MELLLSFVVALVIVGCIAGLVCITNFFMERFPDATVAVWIIILVILLTVLIYFN